MLEGDRQAHCLREEREAAHLPRADSVRTADGGRAEREATPLTFQVLPNSSSSASFKDESLRPCEICARLLRASLAHRTPTPLLEAPVVRGRRAGPRCGAHALHALGPGPRRPPHRTCAPGPPWTPLGPRSQDGSPSGGITRIHCPASLSTQAPCFTLSVLLFRS